MQGTNMADGQLVKINVQHEFPQEALLESIKQIPHGKHALFFLDNENMSKNNSESVLEAFSTRPMPIIPKESGEMGKFQIWLCEPEKRDRDVCIVGTQHGCNGIETDVVVHVHVADCPLCGISNTDPVILSRAKAMLIISTYKRLECPCGWKKHDHGFEIQNESDDQNSSEQMMAAELMPMIDSRPPEAIYEEIELDNKYVKSRYQSQKNILGLDSRVVGNFDVIQLITHLPYYLTPAMIIYHFQDIIKHRLISIFFQGQPKS